MISQERLKELLSYDPDTGVFVWKIFRGRLAKAGAVAGTRHPRGWITIEIDQRHYRAHRLAWLYIYGEMPVGDVDHKNRVKNDNRICNLRVATHGQNRANSKPNAGRLYKGVYQTKYGTFQVCITYNKKTRAFGTYADLNEALRVYATEARKLHGEFVAE